MPQPEQATRFKVEPGDYYIGDPCYVIPDVLWDEFCGMLPGNDLTIDGVRVIAFDTGGDAVFDDQYGRVYPVDSGMLAAVPAEDVFRWGKGRDELGEIMGIGADDELWDDGGVLHFGSTVIRTYRAPAAVRCPYTITEMAAAFSGMLQMRDTDTDGTAYAIDRATGEPQCGDIGDVFPDRELELNVRGEVVGEDDLGTGIGVFRTALQKLADEGSATFSGP